MKEPVVLYTLDRLEYSQEVLLYKEPKELSLTVWIIVMLENGFKDIFAGEACAATSLLNELSTEYTSLTNKVLTEKDAVKMMKAGVANESIDETGAYVNDWNGAADTMWTVMEDRGNWSYDIKGSHTILALDRGIDDNGKRKFHFINALLGNTAFDTWDMNIIHDASSLQLAPYDPLHNPNGETRTLRFKL